jgi:hypothetical protein
MARDKYYDDLATFDKDLANAFEAATGGKPKSTYGKAGAQKILDVLLADGGISSNEAYVMNEILWLASFDDEAGMLFATKLQEAIYLNGALLKNSLQIPANSNVMDTFSANLDLGNVGKIKFTSPGTKISYEPTQFLAIKAMLDKGDITVYSPGLGAFARNPILGGLEAGSYTSDINKLVYYDSYDPIDRAATIVHEATHAIQDWLDVQSTVRFCEADAYIAGAVVAHVRKWTKKDLIPHSIAAVAFNSAAKLVIKGKAGDPSNKDWKKAYTAVTNAVAKDPLYKSKIDDPAPPLEAAKEGRTPESERFSALLATVAKVKPAAVPAKAPKKAR